MSRPRSYNRFMVDVELGGNAKVGRLTDAEFRCLITGVWALAAKAEPRGALLVAGQAADERDVARQAHCSPTVAKRTLAKLRQLGMLERDEAGVEWVHHWDVVNPAPKASDTPEARRERKRRQRDRQTSNGHADVTRDMNGKSRESHATEVKKLEETPKAPSKGALPDRAGEVAFEEWLGHHEQTTGHSPPKAGTKGRQAIADAFHARLAEGLTLDELKLATVGAHEDPHRREHGYDTADSVLRPTKVASLIAKGRLRSRPAPGSSGSSARLIDRLNGGGVSDRARRAGA